MYLFFVVCLVITTILIFVVRHIISLHTKIKFYQEGIQQANDLAAERKTKSYNVGVNTALGNIYELLGKFAYIAKLKDWWFLSGPSKQASIDMIGVRDDYLEIIEFKKNGARITPSENEIRRMVEAQKVRYVVLDVKMPDNVSVEPRELKPVRRRIVKDVEIHVPFVGKKEDYFV